MSGADPIAACDRLARLLERSLAREATGRLATDDAVRAPVVRFAIAQLRMRIRPALQPGWAAIDPAHIVLFGGTNTGKSTVLNLLLGRPAAGMGVRARFSQHPEGYRPAALGEDWLGACSARFAGYREFRDEHPPRQSDDELRRDGYRRAFAILDLDRLREPAFAPPATSAAVVWDGPDYSTEAAGSYLGTVLDLLAMADFVLLAVTDESYADDRGNALLRMLGGSAVAVEVVANKLPDNPTLLDDVARTLDVAGGSQAPVHRLPEVLGATTSERLRRLLATPEAQALRASVAREAARGRELKRQALLGSVGFLERHWDEMLRPLADEAGLSADWGHAVDRLARDLILEPHRRDYLDGVRYGEFNRSLVHLVEFLQVPGLGPFVVLVGRVVRTPFEVARHVLRRLLRRRGAVLPRPPELEILRQAISTWLAALKAEAQARAVSGTHDAWSEVVRRIDAPEFRDALLEEFDAAYAAYRVRIDAEVLRRAESLYERLKESPRRLNALRGANLVATSVSVAIVVKSGGLDWSDAVVGPVVAGLWQNLLGWGLGRYMETLRAGLIEEQAREVQATVAASLEPRARALFPGTTSAGELAEARVDLAHIKAEADRIARESFG